MTSDLCALTDEMLPHYTEGVLPPATRRRIDEHAAECPACRERLERAAATLAPTERQPMPRRRSLLYIVACLVVVLAAAGGWRYAASRRQPGPVETAATPIPAKVRSAEDFATRAIPGWKRAVAAGLVVNLGITEQIGDTDATITLEKVWYSEPQIYLLYTVKAPGGKYLLPSQYSLGEEGGRGFLSFNRSYENGMSEWGGFSQGGFHGVMMLPDFGTPPPAERVQLTVREWKAVDPEAGVDGTQTSSSQMNLLLPLRSALRSEPAPVIVPWVRQQPWLGRTLDLEELDVGIGHIKLSGQITLAAGESDPLLDASLHVGNRVHELNSFSMIPSTTPGRYHFTATVPGADAWPAPVSLELRGIRFTTDQTLEWPVNWANYRDRINPEIMKPEDWVSVHFHDSVLTLTSAMRDDMTIDVRQTPVPPPYVQAELAVSSRGAHSEVPGLDLVNDQGDVFAAFAAERKAIEPGRRDVITVSWGNGMPDSFRQSKQLTLRYFHPQAVMHLNETWELK